MAVWSHEDDNVLNLIVDGELIVTTTDHPFYANDMWVEAGELEVGDVVVSADGDYGVVESAEVVIESRTMYNLTVDEAHTYFIGEGQWLVHNDCPIGMTSQQWDSFQERATDFVKRIDEEIGGGRFSLQEGELNIQGSRVPGSSKAPRSANHPNGSSDIDLQLRVTEDQFGLLRADFHASVPDSTRRHLREIGRGQMSGFTLGTRSWNLNYWDIYWSGFVNPQNLPFDVDFSILQRGSRLDTPPFLPIRRR